MKGVVLAGGKGTRLYPMTKDVNKHILPLGGEPMLFNPIRQLASAGITEIMIISGAEHLQEMQECLYRFPDLGCSFCFGVQREPRGIADALLLAEAFAEKEPIAVILGDNITSHSIKLHALAFSEHGRGAMVLLKEVRDPCRFGVAQFHKGRLAGIEEKPERPESLLAVTGIYFYDEMVFDLIKELHFPDGDEHTLTPVNNEYLQRGELVWDFLEGVWIDAGTPQSYQQADELMRSIGNRILEPGKREGL